MKAPWKGSTAEAYRYARLIQAVVNHKVQQGLDLIPEEKEPADLQVRELYRLVTNLAGASLGPFKDIRHEESCRVRPSHSDPEGERHQGKPPPGQHPPLLVTPQSPPPAGSVLLLARLRASEKA